MNHPGINWSQPAADPQHWLLDPEIIFLNHGSFGACPRHVLDVQNDWRLRIERQPLQFFVRELEGHLDHTRAHLAQFIGAAADDIVFIPNATTGLNAVLRSLSFNPGDELLVTDQEYNASRNALNFVAERSGAKIVVAKIPFPFRSAEDLLTPILAGITPRTKLALLDHVTSQTGIILPIAQLVAELNRRGVDILVDAAHAPGMVPLDLNRLGATYYAGNCHKWLCGPKSAAFLYVRPDKQHDIRPLTISHGANSTRRDRSRFQLEFGWQGTADPSAVLSIPTAIDFMASLQNGGWPQIMAHNRGLDLTGRKILCEALGIPEPCPAEFIGSLASVPLPDAAPNAGPRFPNNEYPLQDALRLKHKIEVPLISWPAAPHRLLRISAQLYNSLPQYEALAKALKQELFGS
ncbi:MAG TPA: aminotransferase class V-fold PLP-dependent enzyme [Verrucomicrobiae bacterium]|nr:aminotransferase class V-fold PLP-dependent enzyme [Verrucomicrobiae bacterium]